MIRLTTPEQIQDIIPHLVLPDEEDKLPLVEGIFYRIESLPDSILVLATYDADDNITSFLVAMDPGPKVPYISLPQVWSCLENDPDWYTPMFTRLIVWSLGLGKTSIRGQTKRDLNAIYRKFRFEPFLQTIKLDLKPYTKGLESYLKEFLK